jgi:hypothetical protein
MQQDLCGHSDRNGSKSLIRERVISLRFLGIILRVFRLEVSDFLNHREGGVVFYQVFLLSPLQCPVNELYKL